ncbi:MAG: OmpA family protein [Gammaproteobacteria bacterium]|nr:OmpA family protein [Gammaproteobacteria bacterium]
MHHFTIFLLLLCLASVNSLANEATQLPYDCELRKQQSQLYCAKPGWYVHGALGLVNGSSSVADFYDPLTAQGYDVSDIVINDQRLGLKFNLGYSFTEHLALEIGYTDLGEVDVAMSALVANRDAFYRAVENLHPTSARGLTISGVATWPLTQSLTVNGRIGIFEWQGDFNTMNVGINEHVGNHDTKGTDLYYGAYGEYLWSKRTRLVLELERYQFDQGGSNMLTFGVKYYFGHSKVHQATSIAPIKPIESTPPVITAASKELRLIILFGNDKSIISANFLAQLDAIGKKIRGHSIELFTITGHTSKIASHHYNQALSERRVDATVNYFLRKFSIKPNSIKVNAYGEDKLRDHRGTAAAASVNRRVELYIKYH